MLPLPLIDSVAPEGITSAPEPLNVPPVQLKALVTVRLPLPLNVLPDWLNVAMVRSAPRSKARVAAAESVTVSPGPGTPLGVQLQLGTRFRPSLTPRCSALTLTAIRSR